MELSNQANIEHHHHRENTLWKHVHPLWIIFQIYSGYVRPANQLHDPNLRGKADRTNSWRSVMFSYTFWGAHWECTLNILQLQGRHGEGRCPKRGYECEAILCYTRWFWSPCWTVLQTDPWEPSFCKSTLMRSQRERKTWCHFGPCPHPIKFDFTRICVETMVYIHLANSWDHDFMCPSLIFPHQKTGVWSFTSSATCCPIVLHSAALTMFLPLLQQGCDLRWETASAAPGLCPGSGGQMRPVFHVAALAWHRILERIEPTRRNTVKFIRQTLGKNGSASCCGAKRIRETNESVHMRSARDYIPTNEGRNHESNDKQFRNFAAFRSTTQKSLDAPPDASEGLFCVRDAAWSCQ